MKFKKIIIIFLILLAVLTIGSVNATDSNATSDTITLDDTADVIIESTQDSITAEEDNKEIVSESVDDEGISSANVENDIISGNGTEEPIFSVKYNSSLLIYVTDTEIEEMVNITICTNNLNLTADNVTVWINGKYQVVDGKNGTFNVISKALVAGNYTVAVSTVETEWYYAAVNSTNYVVFKHASEIKSVDVNPIIVIDHDINIGVEMDNVNGFIANCTNVIVNVAGNNYTVPVNADGRGNLSLPFLDPGSYTVTVYFLGDEYYNLAESLNTDFMVIDKNETVVIITVNDTEVENDVIINITTNNEELTTESVVVFVKGIEQVVTGSKGNFTVIIPNVTVAGNYMVVVGVNSTEWFKSGGNVTSFNVLKHHSEICIISPSNGTELFVGDAYSITIANNTAVNVTINGKLVTIVDGAVISEDIPQTAGGYDVVVSVVDTQCWTENKYAIHYKILKHVSVVNIISPSDGTALYAGDDYSIIIENNTAVNVTINDELVTIVDGAVISENLPKTEGLYIVKVSVKDTNGWTKNTNIVMFTIVKYNATVVINGIENTTYVAGSTFHINATTNSSGMINITVNGKAFYVANNTNINITSELFEAGHYIVTATVYENHNYTMATTTLEFTIVKYNATVVINGIENTTYVAGSTFHINATTNSSGMINITVNGKAFYVANNTNINITSELFEAGHYIVTATVYENHNYTMATTTLEFTIEKHVSEVNIISPDNGTEFYVGDSYYLIIVNNTAVVATINGVHVDGLWNGTHTIVSDVPCTVGHYIVNVFAPETEMFSGKNVSIEYDISRYNTTISVAAKDITFGDTVPINILFSENITSDLTIILNDEIIVNATIENGKAQVNISNLTVGNYDGKVIFYGNSYYSPIHESFTFNVNKLNSTFEINLNPEEGIIELFFDKLSGNITVNVAGNVYIVNVDYKTNASIDLKDLSPNTYNYIITYLGSDIYNPSSKQGVITLSKSIPQLNVENIQNIELGQTQNITVNVPDDATGSVNFIVSTDNEVVANQSSPINEGVAKLTISSLKIGTYGVSAQINDPKYYKTQYNMIFNVMPKISIPPVVKITKEGEITVELSNASGRVKLIIDNQEYLIQKIKDNKVVFIVDTDDFDAGNHTVTFQYIEGSSFDDNVFAYWDEETKQFRPIEYILQILPMEVAPDSKSDNKDEFYEVYLRDENGDVAYDAQGTIEFFVNGVSVAVVEIVDGVAKLDISQYKNGRYVIGWKYSGDTKYAISSGGLILNINRKIVAGDLTALYSEGKTYSVTVYGTNGKVANGVKVTFLINNKVYSSVLTKSNGVASIIISQTPGTYKITATISGLSITKKLTVNHILNLPNVKVKRSAKKLVLKATLKKVNGKYLKGKKITFKFNGKKYTAKTNKKGVAKVTVKANVLKKLKVGKKVKYQATYLKDTVLKSVKVKK